MALKGAAFEGKLELVALGAAPMKDNCKKFSGTHHLTIYRSDDDGTHWTVLSNDHFKATAITKNVPAAIWGEKLPSNDPGDKAKTLVEQALCGFLLTPGKDSESSPSNPIDRDKLVNDEDDFFEKFGLGAAKFFVPGTKPFVPSAYKSGHAARSALVDAFGISGFGSADLDLEDFKDGDLLNFADNPASFKHMDHLNT